MAETTSDHPRPLLWLMKSEPDVFSIGDLEREGSTPWDGVRNYQARNYMRDMMAAGDLVLFYHSNTSPPGIVGVARVVREAYPDPTAFDETSEVFDPKSSPAAPRWFLVDVGFVERWPRTVPLDELKADPALAEMLVVQRGQRLSIQPVEPVHFRHVLALGGGRCRVPEGAGSVVGVLTAGSKATAKKATAKKSGTKASATTTAKKATKARAKKSGATAKKSGTKASAQEQATKARAKKSGTKASAKKKATKATAKKSGTKESAKKKATKTKAKKKTATATATANTTAKQTA